MRTNDLLVSWESDGDLESFTIEIPMPLPSIANRSLRRGNWYNNQQIKKKHKHVLTLTLAGYRSLGIPAAVTLTRIAPRQLDSDNWVASAKSIRDAVACWLAAYPVTARAPDDERAGVSWQYEQRKGKPKYTALLLSVQWDKTTASLPEPPSSRSNGVTPPWVAKGRKTPRKRLRGRPRANAAAFTELDRAGKRVKTLERVETLAAKYGYDRCVESKPLAFMTARARAVALGATDRCVALASGRGWDQYDRKGKR